MSRSREVELKAIEFVMHYEKSKGRIPEDVSRNKNHAGYDIKSGKLKIEVKGRGKDKVPHVFLNENNINGLEKSNDSNYRLYIVLNPIENPRLVILRRKEIKTRKKNKKQWSIPLRKADFKRAINLI